MYILIWPIKSSTMPRFGLLHSNFENTKIHDFLFLVNKSTVYIYAKFSFFSKNVI